MTKRLITNMKKIHLQCKQCNIKVTINTTHPELYTQEVRDNFKCINCKK